MHLRLTNEHTQMSIQDFDERDIVRKHLLQGSRNAQELYSESNTSRDLDTFLFWKEKQHILAAIEDRNVFLYLTMIVFST